MTQPSEEFRVVLARETQKDIRRLRGLGERATANVFKLAENPTKGHALSGTLRGARALEFSMPGGAYRAAYIILEEQRICLVFAVGAHEGFYKRAKRRFEALQRLGEL